MDSGEEQDRRARVCACSVPGRAPAWCWAAGERPLLLLGAQSAGGAPALLTSRERREGEDTDVHCSAWNRKAQGRTALVRSGHQAQGERTAQGLRSASSLRERHGTN
jgi:hypothetical protein